MDIIVDTREQKPLWKKSTAYDNITFNKLDVGDYSLKGHENKIAIERKDPIDLFSTLGKGHKRFKKELDKAQKLTYFAIVIEGSYNKILNKDFEGSYHSKMRGYVITSILFTLHLKYGVNVFFALDKKEARQITKELFRAYAKIYIK